MSGTFRYRGRQVSHKRVHFGVEFPTPEAVNANDFPNLRQLVEHEYPALESFFQGLIQHYPHCVAEGRMAEWAALGHAIIDLMAAPRVQANAPTPSGEQTS